MIKRHDEIAILNNTQPACDTSKHNVISRTG